MDWQRGQPESIVFSIRLVFLHALEIVLCSRLIRNSRSFAFSQSFHEIVVEALEP